jgi:predicted PurR-regulated permease PerM
MKVSNNKHIGWYISLALVIAVFILAVLVLRPILLSIIAGLILAYILYPVYYRLTKIIHNKTASSLIICLGLLIIIIVPLWFLIPIILRQIFDVYLFLQNANIPNIISGAFPSMQMSSNVYTLVNSFITDIANALFTESTSFILNFQNILLHGIVIFFVLFFSLKDYDGLRGYIKSISPLSQETEGIIFTKFKELTNSILFGQVIVGIVQGIVSGIGYFIFGVPNALSFTILTIIVGILPVIGPPLVWIPVDIFLFVDQRTGPAIGLLIYGLIVITSIDSIIRPLIVSKKAKVNSGVVLVGMIGGLFLFGILGFIIGPLILAYAIVILDLYRHKKL